MKLYLNGEEKTVESAATLGELLAHYEINPKTVVVERNAVVVSRQNLAATALAEGDKIEIVQFVGGGK